MPFTVRDLIEGHPEPVCVRAEDMVQKALELMIEGDFSQLPVVDDSGRPVGIITSDSILRALKHFGVTVAALHVADGMIKAVTRRDEDDLFEMLDELRDSYAVLIVDGDGRLIGIVTSYDTTEYFRRRAEDIMLVEDIEGALKEHIDAAFTDSSTGQIDETTLSLVIKDITDTSKAVRGRFEKALLKYLELQGHPQKLDIAGVETALTLLGEKASPKGMGDLTLYDYTQLLFHKSRSDYCERTFGLDTGAIRGMLDRIRETRNDLAHFRGEISAGQREELHFCAAWLEQHPVPELEAGQVSIAIETTLPTEISSAQEGRESGGVPRREEIIPAEEALGPKESRYAPLGIWLQRLPMDRIRLTFEQIEQIIGGELPESARQHRSWWANDSVTHVQSQQWLNAGWRISGVNLSAAEIVFSRTRERERAYIEFFSLLLSGSLAK